jgi:hypothetical protein
MRYPPTGPFEPLFPYNLYDIQRTSPIINPKAPCQAYRPRSCSVTVGLQGSPEAKPCTRNRSISLGAAAPRVIADGIPVREILKGLDLIPSQRTLTPDIPRLDFRILPPTSRNTLTPGSKFLPAFWRFDKGKRYTKSSTGALEGYTKEDFQVRVTAGYVLEDVRGLKWAENGRYVLFAHHHGNGECVDDLLSTPNLNRTRQKRVLRASRPETPSFTPARLDAPWRFTREAVYVEAYPLSTSHTNEVGIERAVTPGYLVSDAHGIRDAATGRYMLRYVGERDDSERVFTPRIRRVEPVSRAATPIEDLEGREGRTKGVRIKRRVEWVDGEGDVVVVDGEGDE